MRAVSAEVESSAVASNSPAVILERVSPAALGGGWKLMECRHLRDSARRDRRNVLHSPCVHFPEGDLALSLPGFLENVHVTQLLYAAGNAIDGPFERLGELTIREVSAGILFEHLEHEDLTCAECRRDFIQIRFDRGVLNHGCEVLGAFLLPSATTHWGEWPPRKAD